MKTILEIKNLHVHFPINIGTVRAVQGVDLELRQGEVMGLVGESGCGKSTLGFSILRLLRPPGEIVEGEILYHGRDIVSMREKDLLTLRGNNISMIFQDPLTSLNPLFRIDEQFIEALKTHNPQISKEEAFDKAAKVLESLGISPERLLEYPHQMSGGMRQRIMIGMALVLDPDLLIADEPTTSLDVIVEAQFLDLLNELRKQYDLTILLITHNLGIVAQLADRITVMYGGTIAETGVTEPLFENPMHPYTKGLLASIPNIKLDQPELHTMEGSPPDLVDPPSGCVFHPRCPQVMDICRKERPRAFRKDDRIVRCWLYR
ncbi:MAG: ABC transporter ATP-binding protein [Deltaproteobacteria bacterium]|nr:ABC transporter ATP-binding protein [Deltaproteobacteria bacterium]MBW2018045.1 ABC transporter ATP-binding protein [Deltaproteobacteria bacterium]MBW2128804.1 ABC transporter ATP-binding protein [Deltaproteobacteria bacterium]MBW2303772.1 ABC transporter ATP-binding protein [Deltaproteobacteria bacterium]